MQRLAAIAFTVFMLTTAVSARIVPKGNIFVGYSYNRAGIFSTDHSNLNGWNGSLEGKIFPFVGIVSDLSGYYGSPSDANVKEHNFLFGPRVSASVGKVRPFAHALFGAAHVSLSSGGASDSDTSFATAVGGGIDYHLLPLVGWRVQGDYLQTRFFSNTQNDFRFSTGLVINF